MQKPVIVVGGGLSGLVCAKVLYEAGIPIVLLEASDRVGGRMKTDTVEGFKLDRGFQVYFDAYPYAAQVLDHDALKLGAFKNGAQIFHGGKLNRLEQPSDPRTLIEMLRSPFLSLGDKLKLRAWNAQVEGMTVPLIRGMADMTAEAHLKNLGFSEDFLAKFARPFFGGIFLDASLQVSKRQFAFIWKMLNEGQTALPQGGIEAIPQQLASSLPGYLIREYSRVESLLRDGTGRVTGVRLDTNETFEASVVVLATDAHVAAKISGLPTPTGSKSSTTLYFETATPCVDGAYLVLNGTGQGLVNHVAPVSNASPSYAPANKHLASVTVIGDRPETDEELANLVREELIPWFPTKPVNMWRFLRAYRIAHAQMAQPAGFASQLPAQRTEVPGLFFSGEFTTNGSIDGAVEAGLKAAAKVKAEVGALAPVA